MNQEPRYFTDLEPHATVTIEPSELRIDIAIAAQKPGYLTPLLVKRTREPFDDWWWISDKWQDGLWRPRDMASRIFRKETTLNLPPERFHFLEVRGEYLITMPETRRVHPFGHFLAYQYYVVLEEDELPQARDYRNPMDYDLEQGFLPLHSAIPIPNGVKIKYLRPLIEVRDLICPPHQQPDLRF